MMSEMDNSTPPMRVASFVAAVAEHNKYRADESRSADIERRSNALRTIITTHLKEWKEKGIPVSLFLDANGLKLDIGGDKRSDGIHTHLPYDYVEDTEIEALIDAEALRDEDIVELAVIDARRRGDMAVLEEGLAAQRVAIIKAMKSIDIRTDENLKGEPEEFDFVLRGVRGTFLNTMESTHRVPLHVPDEDIKRLLDPEFIQQDPAGCVMTVALLAEATNRTGKERDYQYDIGIENIPKVMRHSHRASKGTTAVFDPRHTVLHEARNYDTAKTVNLLFSTYTPAQMRDLGIRVTRGAFKGGTEFIALQHGSRFNRFLVDPEKHLTPVVRKLIQEDPEIPLLKRDQYEFYEALLLPFRAFADLRRTLKVYLDFRDSDRQSGILYDFKKENILPALKSIRTVMETEFDEPAFTEVFNLIRPVKKSIRAGKIPAQADIDALLAGLQVQEDAYRARFEGKSADKIIEERTATINEHAQVYDAMFVDRLPKALREQVRSKIPAEALAQGWQTKICETGEKGLSYAHERKILGAMGLKEASVFTCVGGAKFLNVASKSGELAQKMTQAVLNAAERTGAHILGPETAMGLGLILAISAQERLSGLSAEQREKAPHVFGIGPGGGLAYDGNPVLKQDMESIQVAAPMDIMATPYDAGWSLHGSESQQRRHNYYRQAVINRLSGEMISPIIVADGGGWTVFECTAAAEDGLPILPIKGSGRFADFLIHLKENMQEWQDVRYDDEKLAGVLAQLIPTITDPNTRSAVQNDFDRNELYRTEIIEFLQTVDMDLVRPQTVDTLEEVLVTEHEKRLEELAALRERRG